MISGSMLDTLQIFEDGWNMARCVSVRLLAWGLVVVEHLLRTLVYSQLCATGGKRNRSSKSRLLPWRLGLTRRAGESVLCRTLAARRKATKCKRCVAQVCRIVIRLTDKFLNRGHGALCSELVVDGIAVVEYEMNNKSL